MQYPAAVVRIGLRDETDLAVVTVDEYQFLAFRGDDPMLVVHSVL